MDAALTINRRGACPALAAPMQTGDGLLARLNPVSQGLTAGQLIGLCQSAQRHGNGIVEITARGSIQIRGLSALSARVLAADVNDLAIDAQTGTSVTTSPLAGLDREELVDPRPLAALIRAGIAYRGLNGKLAPKVSVVVDGGGTWPLDGLQADIRCRAQYGATQWQVTLGGTDASERILGTFDTAGAANATVDVLRELAQRGIAARARDLAVDGSQISRISNRPTPLGTLELNDGRKGVAVGLPFGSIEADKLAQFAQQSEAHGATEFRPAPSRTIIVIQNTNRTRELIELASKSGFTTDANDPARRIFACPGAPACSSGHFDTRELSRQIAQTALSLFADSSLSLHVSGCAKGCARPAEATLTLVGDEKRIGIVVGGTARSLPLAHSHPKPLADAMRRLAERIGHSTTTAETLARLEADEFSALFRSGIAKD